MMNHQHSEEVALSNAVSGYIERIKQDDFPSSMGFMNLYKEIIDKY
jgi:hypothetical protein